MAIGGKRQLPDAGLCQRGDGFRGQGLGRQSQLQTEQAGQAVETLWRQVDLLAKQFDNPPRSVGVHLDPDGEAGRTLRLRSDPTMYQEQKTYNNDQANPFDIHDSFLPWLYGVVVPFVMLLHLTPNHVRFPATWLLLSLWTGQAESAWR